MVRFVDSCNEVNKGKLERSPDEKEGYVRIEDA